MRNYRSYKITAFYESLERRLSLSAINCTVTGPALIMPCAVSLRGDNPIPPEPDPGPLPPSNPPITFPPLPPSGPVGPG